MSRQKIALFLSALFIAAATTALFHSTQSFNKDYHRGRRHFNHARYSRALDYLLSAYHEKPESTEAMLYLARTYGELGRVEDAAEMLENLVSAAPGDTAVLEEAADYYHELNLYGRAEELYRDIMEIETAPGMERKLAEVLVWQGKYEEAVPVLERLAEEKPGDYALLEFTADVYAWKGNYDRAARLYQKLLDAGYEEKEITFKLAEVLRAGQRYEEAILLYEKYLEE